MNIEEKILLYKEELDYFEDKMDKYKYLLEQGKKADKFPEEYKIIKEKKYGISKLFFLI